jgi:hypothetical protein
MLEFKLKDLKIRKTMFKLTIKEPPKQKKVSKLGPKVVL